MGDVSRRDFLKRTGQGAGGVIGLGALPALLAACGGDDEEQQAPGNGEGGVIATPKIGLSSSPQATYLPVIAGPIMAGKEFGLTVAKDDITILDSSTTLTQSALSGQVDIAGQSTMAHLILIDQGVPFKIFATYSLSDDFVIAGRGDVKRIEQLREKGTVVASDSPGGAGQAVFDAMLIASDAGFLVTDIPDIVIIESSGERTSALASGDCDATVVHIPQANDVDAETGDVNILARLYGEVPNFMKEAYAARADWLEENVETAAALTASVIQSSRDLSENLDAFVSAVNELVEEPPDQAELEELHGLISEHEFFPVDGGLTDERLEYMIDLGKREGIIKNDLTPDDVVDRRAMERALEQVGA